MFATTSRAALCLLTICCHFLPAHAATSSPPLTDSAGNVYAVEKEGMSRKGYIVHAWQVVNLAQAKDTNILSIRSLVEFNCRFRQARTMWINEHRERDAGGEPVTSGQVSNPEWVQIETGTHTEKLLEFSCSHIMR